MERQPDHTDDARDRDTGQGGYPEEQHPGALPDERTGEGPEGDTEQPVGPKSSGGRDSPPSTATGNPAAAGG